jgi:hypothetical protein
MAPSAYPRISRQLAPHQFPGPGAVEFRRFALAEGLAPGSNGGNNAREWWVVPTRERRRTGRLTLQLTPTTYVKLAGR